MAYFYISRDIRVGFLAILCNLKHQLCRTEAFDQFFSEMNTLEVFGYGSFVKVGRNIGRNIDTYREINNY